MTVRPLLLVLRYRLRKEMPFKRYYNKLLLLLACVGDRERKEGRERRTKMIKTKTQPGSKVKVS